MEHFIGHLIGGEHVPGRGDALPVHEPATARGLGELRDADVRQVDDAVAAAGEAFPAWSALAPEQRGRYLHTLADAIEADMPELTRIEARNVGKPVSIIEFEMDLTLDNWRFFASAGRFMEGRAAGEYMEGYTSMVRREPLGVIGSIAPWNYPLQLLLYTVGLHRFLRWRQPGYDPDRHLGGGLYLFVRGMVGPRTPVVGARLP